ncbi:MULTISPECIES: CpsD/CapB family tyrosine-protein kinase [unclassified Enterococcus]|jgi:capsular exopolysaccharide synthesis family protein|uniref:CpsD/CapB family tyrosine-protein kinase n=1 Tax=unclassified Enterococcus TaxID=2608891 RepID=UPI000352AD1C|nr:putative tyrosine-protein kinase CpsD [Enterococcus faecalis 13-SD-W-01]
MKLFKKRRRGKHTSNIELITMYDKKSPISEQYRKIRTNLQFAVSSDKELKTLTIVSGDPGEGKSTTAANLAVVYAEAGYNVLLIDADMRRPTVAKTFQLLNVDGLSNLLSSDKKIAETIQKTEIDNLSVLVSGTFPPNPAELLNSKKFDSVLEKTKRIYDIILIDVPALFAVADAQIVSSKTDGTVMVVSENNSRKDRTLKAQRLLKQGGVNLVGIVYNNSIQQKENIYYY